MNDIRTALVTGANGGIGTALCHRLSDRGARVIAHARSREKAEATVKGTDWLPVWGDLAKDRDVAAIAEQTGAHLHRRPLDLLVHNAGILSDSTAKGPHGLGVHGEVNVLAPVRLTEALHERGALGDGALVLVVSSTAASLAKSTDYEQLAEPDGSSLFGHYALSKSAANAATLWLAERHPALRVVSVEPGFVRTKMTRGNPSMPLPARLLAVVAARSPKHAAKRVLDHVLSDDVPSGTVLQGRKRMPDSSRWATPEARASLERLLERAGAVTA